MKEFKHGDYVYFKSANSWDEWNCYYGRILDTSVEGLRIMIPDGMYCLRDCYVLDENGDLCRPSGNRYLYCNKNECAETYDSLIGLLRQNYDNKIQEYYNEIETIEDLIRFPLHHCFNGEEYTDWQAVEAYKIRAKELVGVGLSL